jgi:hypothetical protein
MPWNAEGSNTSLDYTSSIYACMSQLFCSWWNAVEILGYVEQQQERRLNMCSLSRFNKGIRRIFRGKILYRDCCYNLATEKQFLSNLFIETKVLVHEVRIVGRFMRCVDCSWDWPHCLHIPADWCCNEIFFREYVNVTCPLYSCLSNEIFLLFSVLQIRNVISFLMLHVYSNKAKDVCRIGSTA